MKHPIRTLAVALLAIAVLLVLDLVEKPSATMHVTLEVGAASIAVAAFLWLWVSHVRRVFT